ncbi:MAG: NAD-binding protein [Actinobacteria bacterium]|nr:NAD-binding protein [Actinomycetota bacterium]
MTGDDAVRGHIVVFGFQGVGRRIVRQLSDTGHRIVVVDPDADATQQEDLQRWGVQFLAGYGHSEDTLEAAGVEQALAVLCVTDDDVMNIRLALLVRDVSARVRIVVRMANASVGTALHEIALPGAVLNVAQLASQSFVEVAVNRTTHAIDLGGTEFLIATLSNTETGTFRSTWGDLAPIAVQPADGSPLESCPGRDHPVEPGDVVTLVGTSREFGRLGLQPATEQATATGPSLRRRMREALAAMSDAVDRPFRVAFAVLSALAIISIVILTSGYQEPDGTKMDVLDAVYFTSETIATVNFGDFYFRDQSTWLRVWAILLILLGATLVALATALLTNALVSRRLAQSLGRQRLTGMKDHIVVIGLGAVGSKVAIDLHDAGYDVAIIDGGDGQRFIPQMRAARIPVLIGEATLPETQAAAGVHRAAGVAVLTSDDLVNIETGLAVRSVVGDRPVPIALRVFSRNLARVIGAGLDAGIARSIAELASPWFVGAALGLDVLGTFYVGSVPFMAARLTVHEGGGLDGITLQDLGARARVVAIERSAGPGGLEYPPRRDTRLLAGDSAFLVGQYGDLLDLLQRA